MLKVPHTHEGSLRFMPLFFVSRLFLGTPGLVVRGEDLPLSCSGGRQLHPTSVAPAPPPQDKAAAVTDLPREAEKKREPT